MTVEGPDLSRAAWRKSSHSNNGGSCIEAACPVAGVVAVRDSTDPDGPALTFTPAQWIAFTSTVKS